MVRDTETGNRKVINTRILELIDKKRRDGIDMSKLYQMKDGLRE